MLDGLLGRKDGQAGGATEADGVVFDVGTEDFQTRVLEGSTRGLVLVDFWAPWCGPCRQLGPALETIVREADAAAPGSVALAKLDTDKHQGIAQQIMGALGIQSIPAVVAFKDGQPVDGFVGALPESQIKEFLARHVGPAGPSPVEQTLEAGETALEGGDVAAAAQAFAAVLQADPANAAALSGMARAAMAAGDVDRAAQILQSVPDEARRDPAMARALAQLDAMQAAANLGDLAEMEARVTSDPDDHATRFDLAVALNAKGDRAGATEALVEIVSRDRDWREDGAKAQLLKFFEAWGPTDPATVAGRKRLSSALFR